MTTQTNTGTNPNTAGLCPAPQRPTKKQIGEAHLIFLSRLRRIVYRRDGVAVIADANGGGFAVIGRCRRCLHCRRLDAHVGECQQTGQFRSLSLLRQCDDFVSGIWFGGQRK